MPESIITSLERLLSYASQKQKITANNIANIATEGYKRRDLKFESVMEEFTSASQLKATNPKHMETGQSSGAAPFEVIVDNSPDIKSGYNNVDIDTEMAEMAENTLKYKFGARKAGDYYKNLQGVIRGGGGQ